MKIKLEQNRDRKFMPGDRVLVIENGYDLPDSPKSQVEGMWGRVVKLSSNSNGCVFIQLLGRAVGEPKEYDSWHVNPSSFNLKGVYDTGFKLRTQSGANLWPFFEHEIQHID